MIAMWSRKSRHMNGHSQWVFVLLSVVRTLLQIRWLWTQGRRRREQARALCRGLPPLIRAALARRGQATV